MARSNRAPRPTPESDALRAEHRAEVLVPRNPDLLPLHETKRTERTPDEVEYLVVGPKEVFGHRRGDRVTLALTKSQAANLIESGHLAVAEPEAVESEVQADVTVDTDDTNGQLPETVKE